ncbi:MAG TPA: DUF2207 domain-containing protein [Candidatus Acidoferrum sp.]|nr:DUF2207 domain-containing protein [Candidatus Acidoferrum sp.]
MSSLRARDRKPSFYAFGILRLSIFAFALLLFCPRVFSRELRIEKFDEQVTVLPNGTVDVTESITFHFIGHWNGVYREIPVEYNTPQGMNYSLFLNVKSITDGSGAKLKFESSRDRHYRKLKIYVPGAEDTTKTIVIEYTVSDALRFFDNHDEFYWNVTGDEWDVPIGNASANITLPEGATGIRTNVFTGAYRSREKQAEAQVVGNGVEVHTTAPLAYHEGLTIAVAFDKGIVHEPTSAERTILVLRSNWPLVIPIFAFAGMFWLWWTRGRDPRLRPIAAQYQPPDQLTPSEVGTLIDNSVDMRDITAAIVDLAVRGYISIEEKDQSSMLGLIHNKEYVFHLKKSSPDWASLKQHEQELLNGLFSDGPAAGATVTLSDLHNQFYRYIPSIKNRVFQSLVGSGYYKRRPDSVRTGYIVGGIVVGFLSIWGAMPVATFLGMAPLPFIIAGILTAAIICIFGWFMPARTNSGARALEGVLGFEDFLAHVESDRFNRMVKTPEMFEKFLPFAMALGVERNWSKAFQNIYTQPPSWYQGSSFGPNFYPYMFVNNLNTMSSAASSVMTSAPRSSGGSGFGDSGGGGDGGSSGGGFGGGGGGGF